MNITEKLKTVLENVPKVFASGITKGIKDQEQAFWDDYQEHGNRIDYTTAFGGTGWNNETIKPKYDIKPTSVYMMFRNSGFVGDLQAHFETLGVEIDFSRASNTQYMFSTARNITRVGVVDVTGSTNSIALDNTFSQCNALEWIDKIVLNENTKTASNTFIGCSKLTHLRIEGTIKQTFYGQHCPWDVETAKDIIEHLAFLKGTAEEGTYTLMFSDSVWEALESSGVAPHGGTWKDYVLNVKGFIY